MKTSGTCCFCDIISGRYRYARVDEPIASNDEFVAIASIGALVEGWTLIVPKTHQLSMKNVYRSSIFAGFIGSVLSSLNNHYGSLIAFEHGANKDGSMTGCGTDHAHLHIVPLDESLLPDIQNSGLQWVECHTSEIASMSMEDEYLFYTELKENEVWQDPIGHLHILEKPTSQFFRRLIGNRIGNMEVTDYRRFPYLNTAMKTRGLLAGSFV